jgi:Glycosyl transferases group 1
MITRQGCTTFAGPRPTVRPRSISFGHEGGGKKVRFDESLREVARSKVCIDLPGNGPFCYRLIDYLAIGSCVVARRHETVLHVPLVDRRDIVYARPDLSDLAELCEYYVKHDAEREEIARNSRKFFDRYLSWAPGCGLLPAHLLEALDLIGPAHRRASRLWTRRPSASRRRAANGTGSSMASQCHSRTPRIDRAHSAMVS